MLLPAQESPGAPENAPRVPSVDGRSCAHSGFQVVSDLACHRHRAIGWLNRNKESFDRLAQANFDFANIAFDLGDKVTVEICGFGLAGENPFGHPVERNFVFDFVHICQA